MAVLYQRKHVGIYVPDNSLHAGNYIEFFVYIKVTKPDASVLLTANNVRKGLAKVPV